MNGRESVETSNFHRVAGDCGPSAVIKAIQLIQARNRPRVRRRKRIWVLTLFYGRKKN